MVFRSVSVKKFFVGFKRWFFCLLLGGVFVVWGDFGGFWVSFLVVVLFGGV